MRSFDEPCGSWQVAQFSRTGVCSHNTGPRISVWHVMQLSATEVPTLSAFSFPVHKAVGTASAMGLMIAVPGVLGFVWSGWDVAGRPPLSLGYVNLAAVAIIAPVSFLMAPLGAGLAHALNPRMLKIAFAVFLLITAVRMLLS